MHAATTSLAAVTDRQPPRRSVTIGRRSSSCCSISASRSCERSRASVMTTGDAHPCRRAHRSSGSSSISLALRRSGCSNASPASRSNASSSTTMSVRTTTRFRGRSIATAAPGARVDAVIATSDLDTVCAGVDEDDDRTCGGCSRTSWRRRRGTAADRDVQHRRRRPLRSTFARRSEVVWKHHDDFGRRVSPSASAGAQAARPTCARLPFERLRRMVCWRRSHRSG